MRASHHNLPGEITATYSARDFFLNRPKLFCQLRAYCRPSIYLFDDSNGRVTRQNNDLPSNHVAKWRIHYDLKVAKNTIDNPPRP